MRRLTEDKDRFINKIAAFFKLDFVQGEYMLRDMCNDISNELNINIDFDSQWPSWDVITKFANTAKTNVDWNLIDSGYDKYMVDLDMSDMSFRWPNEAVAWVDEVKKLYKAYFSAKLTKDSKGRKNPKSFFKDAESFTIVGENEDWLFVAVHTYEAAKFCDSFKLGGAGAKWCIGWDQSAEYWYRYTERDNSHFVLAYNKKEWATDTVKYMIQIQLDEYEKVGVRAWPQNDDPNETLSEEECYERFSINEYEAGVFTFIKWWDIAKPKVSIHPTFDLHDIMDGKKVEIHIEDPAIKLKATPIAGGRLNIFDIPRLVEDHTSRVRLEEICYDGNDLTDLPNKVVVLENVRFMPPTEEDLENWKKAPYEIQKVVFRNLDAISIDNLWIDFRFASLEFQNCKNIYIGTLYSSRMPDSDIDVWNEDMISGNFIHACDVNDIPIIATGNSSSIKIAAMCVTVGKYSVMDYHSQRVGGYDDSMFFYFMDDYNEGHRQIMNSSCLINMISPNTKTLNNHGLPIGAEKHADIENKILYLDGFIELNNPSKDGCIKVFNLPAGWKAVYRDLPDLKIKCYNSGRNEAMFKEAGWKVEEGRISRRRLFEDKSRFVDRIRDYFEDLCYNSDGNYIDEVNILKKEVADILEKDNSDFTLPTYESLRAFVNSQSIDKYKIDWNKIRDMDTVTLGSKAQKDMHDEIVKIYVAFYTQESHNASKKSKRTMFNDKNNFIILDENDDWLFVGMLSYEACKFADSFQCGGAGAKWCIGWERSQEYWRKYIFRDKNRFVLAYNKKTYGSQENQKYMLQLFPAAKNYASGNITKVSVTTWVQSDNPSDVFYDDSTCNTFDITKDQFLKWYNKLWELVKSPYVTKLPIDEVMSGHTVTLDTNESSVRVAPFTSHDIDMYEVVTKADCTSGGNSIREFVFDANEMGTKTVTLSTLKMSPGNPTEANQMDESYIGAKLVFMNFDKVEIGNLFMSEDYSDLTFQQCGMVHIKRAIVPRAYGLTEDWNNSVRNGNYYNAIRTADCNLYIDDLSAIQIDSIYSTPTRFAMFDVPEESKTMLYFSRSRMLGQVLNHGGKVLIDKAVDSDGDSVLGCRRVFIDLRNFKFDESENENFPGSFDTKNKVVHLDKIFEVAGELDDVLSSRVVVVNVRIGWTVEWEGLDEAGIKLKYQYCGELLNNTNEGRIMAKKPMTEGYAAQAKKIKEKKASKYGEYSAAPIMSHGFSKEDYCLQNDVDYSEIDNFDDEYGFFRPEHEGTSWQKFTKLCADYGEQLDKAFEDESSDIAKQNAKARADAIATTKNLLKSGERCRIKVGKKIVK